MNIMALQKVKAAMMDRVSSKSAMVEDVEAFIKATKVMDELLDKTTQITDEQLEKITRTQMQALVTMMRSEEHTSELQSRGHLVCILLLENKNYSHCYR